MRSPLPLIAIVMAFSALHAKAADLMPSNIKRDLILEASLEGSPTVQPGQPIALKVQLVNRSKHASYPVVKPGDGSECGWREPYVFFTADRKNSEGKWLPATEVSYGRCGLFDSNWQKDVVVLKPGESIAIKDWLPMPSSMLEMQRAGQWRLQVHYLFTQGKQAKGGKRLTDESPEIELPEALQEMPTFELVSAPIALKLVRPLDVQLRVRSELKVKAKTPLAKLFDVQLVNASQQAQHFVEPTTSGDARLHFEIEGEMTGWQPTFADAGDSKSVTRKLGPGKSLPLLNSRMNGHWEYPVEDTVRVRAVFTTSTWKPGSIIKSDWVEMKVTP